jgi:hypothetical protein
MNRDVLRKLPKRLRIEIEENSQRKPLTQSELAIEQRRILRELRKHTKPGTRTDKATSAKPFAEVRPTKIIAGLFGESHRQIEKRIAVVEAAEKNPKYRPLVEEMDRTGKVDRFHSELRRAQLEEADAVAFSGPVDAKVIIGDFRVEGHAVEDDSVDLIFTDPPYNRETIPQYGDLAQFAARVLVPGGSLICYFGSYALPEILPLMTPHLKYWWQCALVHTGGNGVVMGKCVLVTWKPLLWFVKGQRRTKKPIRDSVKCNPGNKTLDHEWAQGTNGPDYYIEHLSRKNALIVDPYLGGGTTGVSAIRLGRRFVGFEIDADTARKAQSRIARSSSCDQTKG